jgi:hypothetical protein
MANIAKGETCVTQPALVLKGDNGEKVLLDVLQIKMSDTQRTAVERLFTGGGDLSLLSSSEAADIKNLKYRIGLSGGQIMLICRFDITVIRIDEK